MAIVNLKGSTYNTHGELPLSGSTAPDFQLVNRQLDDVTLDTYKGKRKLISIVPSLDTPTCASSTRKFNRMIAKMDNTVVLVVSADLPFAQDRFCSTEGISNVEPLSVMRNDSFARDYGVLLIDGPLAGLTARAVLVLDESDQVLHAELVNDISREPDYEKILTTLGSDE